MVTQGSQSVNLHGPEEGPKGDGRLGRDGGDGLEAEGEEAGEDGAGRLRALQPGCRAPIPLVAEEALAQLGLQHVDTL